MAWTAYDRLKDDDDSDLPIPIFLLPITSEANRIYVF